jgi:hypothetical protein
MKNHTMRALATACSMLALAGSLVAVTGWAQEAGTEGLTEVDVSAQQEAPDVSPMQEAPGPGTNGSQDTIRKAQQRPASLEARRKLVLERTRLASESMARKIEANPAFVSDSTARTGILVSFKLDPCSAKSSYTGESWVPPPISICPGGEARTAPTVEAKADTLDAMGQPTNTSAEWIPADSEMVTVSPGQGNEVKITVRYAGQSSLKVASKEVSKELSIMAWYKGDAIQVEISQKP